MKQIVLALRKAGMMPEDVVPVHNDTQILGFRSTIQKRRGRGQVKVNAPATTSLNILCPGNVNMHFVMKAYCGRTWKYPRQPVRYNSRFVS